MVRRYQGALLAAARQMTAQVADAEDVAQEAVLQAFRHLHALREREKFRAWLFSILRRQCLKLRQKRHGELPLDTCDGFSAAMPDDEAGYHELLSRLPLSYREVLIARYFYDLSYEEMAEIFHSNPQTMRTRCFRARALLRVEVEREEQETRRILHGVMVALVATIPLDAFMDRITREVTAMSNLSVPTVHPPKALPGAVKTIFHSARFATLLAGGTITVLSLAVWLIPRALPAPRRHSRTTTAQRYSSLSHQHTGDSARSKVGSAQPAPASLPTAATPHNAQKAADSHARTAPRAGVAGDAAIIPNLPELQLETDFKVTVPLMAMTEYLHAGVMQDPTGLITVQRGDIHWAIREGSTQRAEWAAANPVHAPRQVLGLVRVPFSDMVRAFGGTSQENWEQRTGSMTFAGSPPVSLRFKALSGNGGGNDLFLFHGDSRTLERLTFDGDSKFALRTAGHWVGYLKNGTPFLRDLTGASAEWLPNLPGFTYQSLNVSADGRWLIYEDPSTVQAQNTIQEHHAIVRCDRDGSHKRVLAEGEAPSLSPDGKFIVYIGLDKQTQQYTAMYMDADGAHARLLCPGYTVHNNWVAAIHLHALERERRLYV